MQQNKTKKKKMTKGEMKDIMGMKKKHSKIN